MKKKKGPASISGSVGYGKPPVQSRFRKGQSGNPTGKRRTSDADRAQELIWEEAYRLLTIREGEKVTRIPALQAVIRSQIASAAKGNVSAQRAVLKNMQDIEAARRIETAGKKLRKLEEMTDEQLMDILRAERNDQ
jgi:Family of unknown function (DUF5681)